MLGDLQVASGCAYQEKAVDGTGYLSNYQPSFGCPSTSAMSVDQDMVGFYSETEEEVSRTLYLSHFGPMWLLLATRICHPSWMATEFVR